MKEILLVNNVAYQIIHAIRLPVDPTHNAQHNLMDLQNAHVYQVTSKVPIQLEDVWNHEILVNQILVVSEHDATRTDLHRVTAPKTL